MKQLLYLEDDEALAFVTSRALTRLGFEVHHEVSIESVKRKLSEQVFTHVLLDLKIGNQHSLSLIQDIKSHMDIPIVVLTGYGTVRTAVQAMKLGAINFLSKPCGIEEIAAALEETFILPAAPEEPIESLAKPSLKALEWEAIQRALDENKGNISAAARQLKMHRRTLQRKLNKKNMDG